MQFNISPQKNNKDYEQKTCNWSQFLNKSHYFKQTFFLFLDKNNHILKYV